MPDSNPLKYYFAAYFKDGSFLEQAKDDVSKTDPTRSSFYDLMQEVNKGNDVQIFTLTDGKNNYLVDLRDGHFEINGVSFKVHDGDQPFYNRRLVFFRRHKHGFNLGMDEISHTIVFLFGWQANETEDPASKNHQFTIEIE